MDYNEAGYLFHFLPGTGVMSTTVYSGADVRLVSPLMSTVEQAGAEAAESPPAHPEAWQRLLEELERLRTLGTDWDGQGAEPPAADRLSWALEWVRQMGQYRQAIPP